MDHRERKLLMEAEFDIFGRIPGVPYGPNLKQKPLFMNRFSLETRRRRGKLPISDFNRLHTHSQDVCLSIGGARCHGIDTPVLMFDGIFKMIQDVQVGDLMMGPDSLPRKVTEVHRGREEMYKVTPNKGTSFTCNASHNLSLKTSGYRVGSHRENGKRVEHMSTGEVLTISVRDYLNLADRNRTQLKLHRADVLIFNGAREPELDPYFLGIWLGDGHSAATAITSVDPEIIAFVEKYAIRNGLQIRVDKRRITFYLTTGVSGKITKNPVKELLKEYGLLNNKHIPLDFLTSTIEYRINLLAGLLDTDGHLAKDGKYFEISQKRKELAEQIVFLARGLGFGATITEMQKYCVYKGDKRWGTYYRVNIFGDIERIPTRIARKRVPSNHLAHRTNHLVTGFKTESLGVQDFYGVTVSGPDNLYLLGDLTVTCNSGKTSGAVAVTIDTLLRYPGAQAIVGSKTYQDLKDTVMEEWRKRFTVHKNWDHPFVESKPTDHTKILRLYNGSFVRFMHFEDFERLRGREADIVHLDEASQMNDARAFQELLRRLSGSRVPIRQFLLTTNPPEVDNWLHQVFQLKQFEPGYDGEPIPIGERCKCQFCQHCLNLNGNEIPWNFTCDPENPELVIGSCPECDAVKTNDCDGEQNFMRVILSSAKDNPAVPADWLQTQKATQDENTFALYSEGKLIKLREGKVFKSYGRQNVLNFNKEVDLEKPIHWTFDFNISYQCSAIIQTMNTVQGVVGEVLDEIILPESGPSDVAKVFMKRYPMFSTLNNPKAPPILLYGDPAGLNRATDGNERSKFQIVFDLLTENGYRVDMIVKKIKGQTQIPVLHSIDAVNTMLCNADGVRRLYFNPKCEWTLISMEGTKYKEKVEPPAIDKQCDDNAARNPDKKTPKMLTHPGDAVRYWVVKVDPVIKGNEEVPYVHIPGEGIIKISPKGDVIFEDARGREVDQDDTQRTVRQEIENMREMENMIQDLFWGW